MVIKVLKRTRIKMVKVEIIINEDMFNESSNIDCYIQECKKATQKEYLIARKIAGFNYAILKDKSVDDLLKIAEAADK